MSEATPPTTGRNFAAGMSGGFAFVFDEDANFEARCNKEMVELEAIGKSDAEMLRGLLEEHVQRTSSRKALELLDSWEAVTSKFVKVVPSEYRRALEAQESPATNGVHLSTLPPSVPYVSTGRYVPQTTREKSAVHG